MGLALLLAVFFAARHLGLSEASRAQSRAASGREQKVVAIDAGHGGNDPGKVGVNGSLEKDINLAVAERLKRYLEQSDVQVVMTREEDKGLYRDRDQRKKMADMKKRCQVINKAEPDAVVSIHQNSYPQEDVSGGQVFYYRDSGEGRRPPFRRGEWEAGQEQRQLLSSAPRGEPRGDRGVRLSQQLGGGKAAGGRGVPGPAGLDHPHGHYGVLKRRRRPGG